MTILERQLRNVRRHFDALSEYRNFIDESGFDFRVECFEKLDTAHKAVLEAYVKRFASLQDYLGAKVFKSLLDRAEISYSRISEVLTLVEKEGIIDLDRWIEFRNLRNDLEHDYPDELEEALEDLKSCVENFDAMQRVVENVFQFAERYDARL